MKIIQCLLSLCFLIAGRREFSTSTYKLYALRMLIIVRPLYREYYYFVFTGRVGHWVLMGPSGRGRSRSQWKGAEPVPVEGGGAGPSGRGGAGPNGRGGAGNSADQRSFRSPWGARPGTFRIFLQER
jgi:hypothetical protein